MDKHFSDQNLPLLSYITVSDHKNYWVYVNRSGHKHYSQLHITYGIMKLDVLLKLFNFPF